MCEDEENWEISMKSTPKLKEDVETIKSMCDCGYVKAWRAYMDNDQDVVKAIESLFDKPVVSGEKYIPKTPKIENGLTPEQEERCRKGRMLQDKVNAVFSVAHSKVQSGQSEELFVEKSAAETETQQPALEEQPSQPSNLSSLLDSTVKNPPQ